MGITGAVEEGDEAVFSVLGVVESAHSLVEHLHHPLADVLRSGLVAEDHEVVAADMADETAALPFEGIAEHLSQELDGLIPTDKTVPVIEGFEVVEVGVDDGEMLRVLVEAHL